MTPAATSRVQS